MTDIEKDRFYELIFYQYFNNRSSEQVQDPKFWKTINTLCEAYDIDPVQITKAIRILSNPDDQPEDIETYYLANKAEMSVRKINKVFGLYWQKQILLAEKIKTDGNPAIRRRVTDIMTRSSIKEFINAIYDVFGILGNISISSF